MNNFSIYLFALLALVVGIIIIKKVTSCLFRLAFTVIVIIALAAIYYLYLS